MAAEQNEKDQRGLQKIIVECREKLAPEQRREAPRQQEWRHAFCILQSSMRRECKFLVVPKSAISQQKGRPEGRPR
jgi:hypothetical protein